MLNAIIMMKIDVLKHKKLLTNLVFLKTEFIL